MNFVFSSRTRISEGRWGAGYSLVLVILFAALTSWKPAWSQETVDESVLWQALRDGTHVAIVRHALAPGIGDPEEFDVDDCDTQRNLSEAGRAQASRLGDRFRHNGIDNAMVYSSAWCRCIDTAVLLGLGPVTPLPALNSFFRNYERSAPQTVALRDWLGDQPTDRPLVMVTHQVNISALVGGGVTSGEMVVFRQDAVTGIEVLGRITTPY